MGVTLTAVPLVTAMFPGVIMPVPSAKTPVRLAVPPTVTAVGLAVKLVMVGEGEKNAVLQPVRPTRLRLRAKAQRANTVTRIIVPFVTEATRVDQC